MRRAVPDRPVCRVRQAEDYQTVAGEGLGFLFMAHSTSRQSHPWLLQRAIELKRWAEGGEYAAILGEGRESSRLINLVQAWSIWRIILALLPRILPTTISLSVPHTRLSVAAPTASIALLGFRAISGLTAVTTRASFGLDLWLQRRKR